MIISSYLAWQNRQDPLQIYTTISNSTKLTASGLFPSHIRYMSYISQVIEGYKVIFIQFNQKTICLKKVIINGIPLTKQIFKPYLQFFKSGNMIYNTSDKGIKIHHSEDSSICFDINLDLSGDILVRFRDENEVKRETIFRFMFNTAFTDEFTLRLHKHQLDGCNSDLYSDELMLDLFFTSQISDKFVVPENVKKHDRKTIENPEDDEEEKIDRELLEKYKPHIEHSADEDEDFDDYFSQLESIK